MALEIKGLQRIFKFRIETDGDADEAAARWHNGGNSLWDD